MGMSEDLDIALEEGATLVRIGTAIFGSPLRDARARREDRVPSAEATWRAALVGGLIAKGADAGSISVVEVSPAARERLPDATRCISRPRRTRKCRAAVRCLRSSQGRLESGCGVNFRSCSREAFPEHRRRRNAGDASRWLGGTARSCAACRIRPS